MLPQRISIDLTNRCSKGCEFCYNGSHPTGTTSWTPDEVVQFVRSCAHSGTQAVSFGGGEPLEFAGWEWVLTRLRGQLFRSLTTNGLHLEQNFDRLVSARPEKVHLSIHFPDRSCELERVIEQVDHLAGCEIRSGVNLLVRRSQLEDSVRAAERMRQAGISNDRIVYLPMRGRDTPTPRQLATVAGGCDFQSTICLRRCGRSPRFAAVSWDRQAAWCSYTVARRPLRVLTARGLVRALEGLPVVFCGGLDVKKQRLPCGT